MLLFFSIVHVLLCIFMMLVILLQPGKDAGMGAALGGGAVTTAFGGRGAVTFLSKVTAVCAVAFFVTSLGLSFVGLRQSVAAKVQSVVPPKASTPNAQKAEGAAATGAKPEEAPGKAAPPDKPTSGTEAVPADKLPAPK